VVVDRPGVGENLQDHPIVAVTYHCTEPISLEGSDNMEAVSAYLETGRGPFTSNGNEAGGFLRLDPAAVAPDLQLHFNPAWFVDDGFANPEGHGFTIGPIAVAPRSRGCLRLRSPDPHEQPAVDPAYLADERDLDVLVEGVQVARRIAASKAFESFAGAEYTPGEAIRSADEIRTFVRRTAGSAYHPAGTCRMGVDERAVVDPHLRVHGVDGLRVVDASVMPVLVNGNPNAAVIMIAEKAADVIMTDARHRTTPEAIEAR
jgi:choline dehydrogenase